jgi:hypothetical protein
VALSGDTALIGAAFDDDAGLDSGSAYAFVRSGGVWTEQQKLKASDATIDILFGSSVALSGDTALIGAKFDTVAGAIASGSAYVFVQSGGVWTEQQKLTASDGAAYDLFGESVALSGDTALIGAPSPSSFVGASGPGTAYVFVRSGGVWNEQQKLAPSDNEASDEFGSSVGVSGDVVVVGAPWRDVAAGAAFIFEPDTTPPTIARATATPNVLSPPNHNMVPVQVTVAATDESGAAPICRIISVSSNEPADGTGDGHTAPDWEITGELTLNLRAERSGRGGGRAYNIVVECRDASGNTATSSVVVKVPRNQRKP